MHPYLPKLCTAIFRNCALLFSEVVYCYFPKLCILNCQFLCIVICRSQSGNQAFFDNRVGWAKTYLKKAGLVDSPKRATFVITDLGLQTLAKNPPFIDAKYLRQFPSFLEFQNAGRNGNDSEDEVTKQAPNVQTPEENLDKAYQRIRKSLASELLNNVVDLSPYILLLGDISI